LKTLVVDEKVYNSYLEYAKVKIKEANEETQRKQQSLNLRL
jgi:hypothetical protein